MCTPSLKDGFQSRVEQLSRACQEAELYLANLKTIVDYSKTTEINKNPDIDRIINTMKKLDDFYCPLLKINSIFCEAGLNSLDSFDWIFGKTRSLAIMESSTLPSSETKDVTSPSNLPIQISFEIDDNFFCVISHVENPNSFYIIPDQYYNFHTEMAQDLNNIYSKNMDLQPCKNKSQIISGKSTYFVYKENLDNQSWCRCVIVDVLKNNLNKIKILLIDVGKKLTVDVKSIYPLDKKLYKYPALAFHSCLYKIQPLLDGHGQWTKESIKYMKDFLFCHCEVFLSEILPNGILGLVLTYKDTVLNLDIVCKDYVAISDVKPDKKDADVDNGVVSKFEDLNLVEDFLRETVPVDVNVVLEGAEYTDENEVCRFYPGPPATSCFKKDCKKLHIPLNEEGWTVMKQVVKIIPDPILPKVDSVLSLRISPIINYKSFYAQIITSDHAYTPVMNVKNENIHYITKIMNDPKNQSKFRPLKWIPACGECVAAKVLDKWQRAMVISVSEPKVDVFLVDFGLSLEKELRDIRELDPEFFKIPKQAVYCSLANVKSVVRGKNKIAIDYLKNITNAKCLTGTVMQACEGTSRLEIILYDDNGVNVGESMKQNDMVTLYTDSEMKNPFNPKYFPA